MTTQPDGPEGYRILQTIGHGASSTVYEAQQDSTGRRVALKVVAASMPGGDAERLYTRERAVLAELGEHSHIVSIVDAGEWDGRFWLAMEYCPYGSVVRTGERLAVPDAVAVLTGIGSALETAHRAALVHRDVKPANILRNRYGSPALADFGIATFVLGTGQGSTATGYTLDHASPEAIDGERPTGASDVWSLGTTMWELLEGRPPFRRTDEVAQSAVIRRICFDPTPPLSADDLPDDLTALIDEMTAKAPDDRPSIDEVLRRGRALEEIVGTPDPERWARTIVSSAPTPAPLDGAIGTDGPGPSPDDLTNVRPPRVAPAPPVEAPARPTGRPWLAVAAVVLALVLLGGGGAVTWQIANARTAEVAAPAAPTTTSSWTPPPSSPALPTTTEAPVVVADAPARRADPGTEEAEGSKAEPSDATPEASAPKEPETTVGDIKIINATCRFTGNSCSSTSNAVAFNIQVTDSKGNVLSDGCTASTTLSKAGKNPSSFGRKACSSRVSFNANGSGDYTIRIEASWNGSTRSKSFGLVTE